MLRATPRPSRPARAGLQAIATGCLAAVALAGCGAGGSTTGKLTVAGERICVITSYDRLGAADATNCFVAELGGRSLPPVGTCVDVAYRGGQRGDQPVATAVTPTATQRC